ncbi:MAG: LytTR family transcriptional regulator [Oscillospiraceae bacterium]|nr:LytTR family transcriptional regulator [Oscillospiraceae bacterium]
MQVEVRIDAAQHEPRVIILTDQMTEDVQNLVRSLTEHGSHLIAGFSEDTVTLLDERELLRIYAASGKVYAVTDKGEYLLRSRLYELEARLAGASFVRISNSEIVNLKRVRHFDLSLAGTICVTLSDGSRSYVSRRFVSKIKNMLGI